MVQRILPVLALVMVWIWWELRIELPIRASSVTMESFDSYAYYYPMFRYAFEQLRAGEFPFWNPYQHGGSPFFATAQHLLFYPLNLLFLVLPTHLAMKWTAIVHLTLAVLFTALLSQRYGMRRLSAVVAGVVFAASPAIASLLYNPHHLYGAIWIPLHLALTRQLLTQPRKARTAIMLGASFAAQYLGGYPMMCLFSVYAVGACFLWHVIVGWRSTPLAVSVANTSGLAVAAALALCLSLPQLLPALELAALSPRSMQGLSINTADSYVDRWDVPLWYVATAFLPRFDHPFEGIPHVGVIGLVLGIGALLLRRPSSHVVFFGLLALVSAMLALGQHTPLYSLYFMLPTANWFRVPTRFFILTSLGLAMLTGFGIDMLLEGRVKHIRMLVATGLTALIAVALAAWLVADGETLQAFRKMMRFDVTSNLTGLSVSLFGLSLFFLAYLRWPAMRRTLVVLISMCTCAGLVMSFSNFSLLPDVDPEAHVLPVEVASFLRGAQGFDRTYIPPWGTLLPATMLPPRRPRGQSETRPIPAKAGMIDHLYVVGDRENTYPVRFSAYVSRMLDQQKIAQVRELLKRWNAAVDDELVPQGDFLVNAGSPNWRLLDLFGTALIVDGPANPFDQAAAPERFPVIYDQHRVRVYRNTAAVPRARLVHELEVVDDPAQVLDRLTQADFDPIRTVVLEEDPSRKPEIPGGNDAVHIVSYSPHEVVLDVTATSPALLVLSDMYYPGWRAAIDGVGTTIYRANYLFRAVSVDAGHQRIVFRFVPMTFYRGCLIGAVGLLCVLAILWRIHRRLDLQVTFG